MLFFSWLPLVPSLSSKSYNMNNLKEIERGEDCFGVKKPGGKMEGALISKAGFFGSLT